MRRHLPLISWLGAAVLVSAALASASQPFTAGKIVRRNVRAAGGEDALARVENFSFRDRGTTCYVSSSGDMKMTSGKAPVITEVTLVNRERAVRNCFNKVTDFDPLTERILKVQAALYGGMFTLARFGDTLRYQGERRFGPKTHHVLAASENGLEVEFYVDAGDFTLRRVVFKGFDPETGKVEINHDFGPYQEVDGLKIPSSWFASRVGTRGTRHEIRDVVLNPELEEGFFASHAINAGSTEFAGGVLKGNVVDFSMGRGNRIMVSTNWTDECLENAGFGAGDTLSVVLEGTELEVSYYPSGPPRSTMGSGASLMLKMRGAENFTLVIPAEGNEALSEKLRVLMPIQAKKKE